MSEVTTEQPAQADSGTGLDALMDRLIPGEETEVQQPAETQAAEQTEEQPAEVEQAPAESEEIDFEGLKLALPKEHANKLKSAIEAGKDYTRKTQEVAEQRKLVELRQQQWQLQSAFQQAAQPEISALSELDAALKQFDQVNWNALSMEEMVRTRHARDQLKEQKEKAQQALQQKAHQYQAQMSQVAEEARRRTDEVLSKHIQKWGPETQNALIDYARSTGFSDVELQQPSTYSPHFVQTLWKAKQWDQLQAAKPLATKKATGVPPVVRPGSTKPVVSGNAALADTTKQLHQAKDPTRKKALLDRSLDLKLDRFFGK